MAEPAGVGRELLWSYAMRGAWYGAGPGGGVEHAVGAEVDVAAVVVGGATEVVPVEDRGLAAERRLLRVAVVDGEAAELIVLAGGPGRGPGAGVGVIEVDEVVRAVIGV